MLLGISVIAFASDMGEWTLAEASLFSAAAAGSDPRGVWPRREGACYAHPSVGRTVFYILTLGLFAACGGRSVHTSDGAGGEGASGGSQAGRAGKGGKGGKGGSGGTGGVGGKGAAGGVGGRTGGTGGVGGATGGGPAGTGGLVVCPAGYVVCGVDCVDLSTDRSHCGACGNACLPGALCEDGACELACEPGLTDCFGLCVNTSADRRFCGSCDVACGVGQLCEDGECVLGCQSPLVPCGDVCTSLDTDPENCGACNNLCPRLPSADATCTAGACGWECDDGTKDCNGVAGDGCEAELADDRENCGACGNECESDLECVNGVCSSGTYGWTLVTDQACTASCGGAPTPLDSCEGPWACGPTTLGGLIWIYAGGPNPPPNPVSSDNSGFGWVDWYCDPTGCVPDQPVANCEAPIFNFIYQCTVQ
jgi:hypothetical protein